MSSSGTSGSLQIAFTSSPQQSPRYFYISIYFRSAANRINLFILGHVRVSISRKWINRFQNHFQFWKRWFECFIFSLWPIRHFRSLTPKTGLLNRRPRITQKGWLRLFRKLLKLANYKLTAMKYRKVSTLTGNAVISYFRSTANRVHATATAADFTFTKLSETARASNFAPQSARHSSHFDRKWHHQLHPAGSQRYKDVRFLSLFFSWGGLFVALTNAVKSKPFNHSYCCRCHI